MKTSEETRACTDLWKDFPLMLCINLKEREDRYAEAIAEFRKAGLENVIFYRTNRNNDRNKGCIDSHMACLEYAITLGVPYVLVLEDDVEFRPGYEDGIRNVRNYIQTEPDWQILYLGGFIYKKNRYLTNQILEGSVLCTQAYVIKTEFAQKLLDWRHYFAHKRISVDLFYTMMIGDKALVHSRPMICTQRASVSDGTWDKREVAKEGWLGKAMLYTAMDKDEQKSTDLFPKIEKFKIGNGLMFFRFYTKFLRLQQRFLNRGDRRPPLLERTPGEFVKPRK